MVEITFGVYNTPVLESENFKDNQEEILDAGTVLAQGDNYLKMYSLEAGDWIGASAYLIMDGNTSIMVSADTESDARKILLDIGYPDRDWASGEEVTTDNGQQSVQSTEKLKQRDMLRKNDMEFFLSMIQQYQANNQGSLPEGQSFWRGTSTISCNDGNAICNFVKTYLNIGEDEFDYVYEDEEEYESEDEYEDEGGNDFVDPSGEYYSVFMTENWAKNGSITTTTPTSGASELVALDDGYTIGGSSPFKEHIIYYIPGSSCNSDKNGVVKAQNERSSAVLYMLEDGSVFCTN